MNEKPRRRFRFSLRTMLLGIVIVAGLAWLAQYLLEGVFFHDFYFTVAPPP
jgi:hypothetical protein